MTKALAIMSKAATLLLDEDFVRWPAREMAGWLDEGVKATVMAKPSASTKDMPLKLAKGTRQTLPEDLRIVQLVDITRNLDANGNGGRMIRPTTRANLDTHEPRWHDRSAVPYRREVRQFTFDEVNPRSFFTYPGNDGQGIVEAVVSVLPETLISRMQGNGSALSSWDIEIGLPEVYEPALLEYLMYRCWSKEDPSSAPGRAVSHYQVFASTLGIQSQVESGTGPKRKQ